MSTGIHGHLPAGAGGAPLQRAPILAIPTGGPNDLSAIAVSDLGPFGIGNYDTITMTYSGSNVATVVYSLGGETVGTLTMTYDGSGNLTKVVRS